MKKNFIDLVKITDMQVDPSVPRIWSVLPIRVKNNLVLAVLVFFECFSVP